MAHHKSAIKRNRTSGKQRLINKQFRRKLHTVTKAVMEADSKEKAQASLTQAIPLIDKLSAKGLIHRNKAAHRKSRLTKHANTIK
jgi:small subunit ribosomal protein S20